MNLPIVARLLPLLVTLLGGCALRATDPLEWQAGTAPAPDGTAIAFYWSAPPGAHETPAPVVIFLHGAPGGVGADGLRGLLTSSRWTRYQAAGFAVCVTDYRGHPANQPFTVIRGETNATDDLAAVVAALASQPQLDLKRLIVTGQSLGGLITLEAVSRGKIKPTAIMVSAPATFPFLGYRGARGGKPDRDLSDQDIDRSAALARVEAINVPVLIVQGTGDGLCALNKKLFELFQAAHQDARLELFDGAPHGFVNGPENDDYLRALELMVNFATQHTVLTPPEFPARPDS